ncbi:MAG TPA: multidrug efflux RND transporter permease subunit, partial [Sandaracinaceae bacterium]
MPRFFVDRPIFAWVIAIIIALAGVLAIPRLPMEQYPAVAPPQIVITATYPGATPETLDESVVSLIERELSGVDRLLYFESTSDTSGTAQITVTFAPGTDPDLAQVDVQNRLRAVEPRLPQVVRQTGLLVEEATASFLSVVTLQSEDGSWSQAALGDYMARNIADELRRLEGVGRVQMFTAEQSMRVWIDPVRLVGYGLDADDVTAAIAAQNALVAPGRLGEPPAVPGQAVTVPLRAQGQLRSPEEFGRIVLRSMPDGSRVLLRDVARIEIGPQSFAFNSRLNGEPVASLAVQLAPGANAVATSERVRARLEELAESFPPGLVARVPYDTAPFVELSIEQVVETLVEAIVLVFLVMFVFLQSVRYTFIPAIVVPVALLGTFAVMLALGFSINVLTMFGLVMAIGILVDDAIVVVENVERIMSETGMPPRDATIQAMREITGAVIGVTLVLAAVFVPMAFTGGSVGIIFRQFTVSMAVSILFSAFLALSLTPALCATLLKPVQRGHAGKRRFFGWFNRRFDAMTRRYVSGVRRLVRARLLSMLVYAIVVGVAAFLFLRLPSSFLPEEDRGFVITMIQLPPDATMERTLETVERYEAHVRAQPAVRDVVAVVGFGFIGAGQNAALAFTMLDDFGERAGGATAQSIAAEANAALAGVPDGMVMTLLPPAIPELGTAVGFNMRLEDRQGRGREALFEAQAALMEAANRSPLLSNVYVEGLPPGPVLELDIDREKARAMGVTFDAIAEALSTVLGSSYVNDFPNQGRMQRVIVQAEAEARMQLEDVLRLEVVSENGETAPLSTFVTPRWSYGASQLVRYNGYPAARFAGTAAPGGSSGEAMAEMERLAREVAPDFTVEWTGQSYQELLSRAQAPLLLGLTLLVVFLVLAALYESWALPLSVILVVPLGLLGAVVAVTLRGLPNDVFLQVGLITIIGLSGKNAILIVEYAKQL